MRKLLLGLLIFSLCGWGYSGLETDNSDLLDWETRSLVWPDFKGQARYDGWEAAVTSYKIGYRLSYKGWGEPKVDIFCQFVKSQSWVRRDAMTKDVLNHEQKHFDLAEVYARKMRKRIEEAELRDYSARYIEYRVEKIYQEVWNECSRAQDRYDDETRHGLNANDQEEWDALISDLLLRYAAYRS